jgi:hypothetical protein
VNVGEETRIYHGRWANTEHVRDYHAEVALATLPRDRWGALGLAPGAEEGAVWTGAVALPQGGCDVLVNADGAAGIRVEVADERFKLIERLSGEHAGRVRGRGGLDCRVKWEGEGLSRLGRKPVRFRVKVRKTGAADPRLYAVHLRQA